MADHTDVCKTVRIVAEKTKGNPDGFTDINESDFDPAKHEKFGADQPRLPVQKLPFA